MGHLINPIAFRLGINKSWENTWFIKNIYYAEFLHNFLNLRNFIYRSFTNRDVIDSGIFLSEITFFKYFKSYIINIYIYHLELEKVSYRFINKLYTNYYKKEYTKELKIILPPNYWFLHNADLYAFIFIFYHIFFNATNKIKCNDKKSKFNFKVDNNMMFLINKFNRILLKKVRGKNRFINFLDLYLNNLVNRSRRLIGIVEWRSFIQKMKDAKYLYKKNFRYNYYKHNLIMSKLNSISKDSKDTNQLIKWKKKYRIKGKTFFNLIYSYIVGDNQTYYNLKQEIKLNEQLKKKKKIKHIYINRIRRLKRFTTSGRFWSRKAITPQFDYDKLLVSSDNIIDNFFLNIFLYLGRKVCFAKFKNYIRFNTKWGYLIKFLKFLDSLEYKSWFRASPFFLYLSSCLYVNLKAKKKRVNFFVRDLIYRFIYIWLGKRYFFPFFKGYTDLLYPILADLINFSKIKINYFLISVNDVSARFIATYISLKLKKNHNLKSIINPVKRELWRLSRVTSKVVKDNKFVQRVIKFKRKKRFIKLLNFIFFYYGKIFYEEIKKNNSMITIDFFLFKLNLLENTKKISYINKYMEINIFFDFFYGKLQNNFDINILRSRHKRRVRRKKKRRIFFYFFTRLNYLSYFNIKRFRIIKMDYFLVFTNILKHFITFNLLRNLWEAVNAFNKRDSRKNINEYKKSGLIAFKMSFKGRFSRKQRASSIWYSNGRASLNRLDLKVDYAFVKVPLKNSIVSIKIWLFRNFKRGNYKFLLNF